MVTYPLCHTEFISAPHMQGFTCEILKQVQDDREGKTSSELQVVVSVISNDSEKS
ncbi:hypothetical protein [Mucilaginibacter segetis]|uniref:Uncharacterized protein n=1 Tax=Mucilaginibacter segetis TaxID=2793071 RepID=A0A934PSX2_9SPHI|nr:hypothetical protein [Mucilaginibacter segetis]MBK0378596.1 hypothetical protein [Mucilaginibacter segetis]